MVNFNFKNNYLRVNVCFLVVHTLIKNMWPLKMGSKITHKLQFIFEVFVFCNTKYIFLF